MTDLEMTILCAKAMGYEQYFPKSHWTADDRRHFYYIGPLGLPVEYKPLIDDAQAMGLVKRFNIGWDKEAGHEWHIALLIGNRMFNAHDMNLNRAICECVAKTAKGEL